MRKEDKDYEIVFHMREAAIHIQELVQRIEKGEIDMTDTAEIASLDVFLWHIQGHLCLAWHLRKYYRGDVDYDQETFSLLHDTIPNWQASFSLVETWMSPLDNSEATSKLYEIPKKTYRKRYHPSAWFSNDNDIKNQNKEYGITYHLRRATVHIEEICQDIENDKIGPTDDSNHIYLETALKNIQEHLCLAWHLREYYMGEVEFDKDIDSSLRSTIPNWQASFSLIDSWKKPGSNNQVV